MTSFTNLVDTSQRVGSTTARRGKVQELATFLRTLQPDEIATGVQFLSGETNQGKIGIGHTLLYDSSSGPAAPDATLSIGDVDLCLTALAVTRGAGAAARRAETLRHLFSLTTVHEREFLIRLLLGELRQGALAGVMLDAIATAAQVPVGEVRRAAMYSKSLGAIARVALLEGRSGLDRFELEIMSPIAPMLAQTAADTSEALRQLRSVARQHDATGEVAFEWKMDGARIQVHKAAGKVRIYTRSLNDVTAAVPEIAELVGTLPVQEVILDGEAIAFTASGRPHPFQVTMRRFGRKLDVDALRSELPMRAFFFDCLRFEGRSLTDLPAHIRFESLAAAVPPPLLIPRLITASAVQANTFFEASLASGHEGVMAKSLDAPYEAGSRGASWLKIKRVHTLDLVVLAAEWGSGRRTGKLSNLHLGALDPATNGYVMLGKTFKGLTDEMLRWQTDQLLAREVHRDQWTVHVRPELVVEVAFSDLQVSRRYPGGLALRLARVKRYRNDKRVEDADTMELVRRIFQSQE